MKKNICMVFDMDGTLFDTRDGIIKALNCVLRKFRGEEIPTEDEFKYIGPSVKESLIKFNNFGEKEAEEAACMYRQVYVEKFITETKMYDGVEAVLRELQSKNVLIGIATMKTMTQVDKLLKITNFKKYFSFVEAAKVDGSVSKKDMLIKIRTSHKECGRYIMIGDTLGDYDAAVEANYEFLAADYGYGDLQEKDVIHIRDAFDILPILKI